MITLTVESEKKWSSQIQKKKKKPRSGSSGGGVGGRMGRGIRRHELHYKLWGCESCMVTIVYKRNTSGDTPELLGGAGLPRLVQGSPLTWGSCKLGAALRRLSERLQHGRGYPLPQTAASDPPSPHTPDAQHKLTEHFFVEHFSGTENRPV